MFSTPFNQQNPLIVQIRRELRAKLPDQWVSEVAMILEYQMSYQTLDEMDTDSILKLNIAAEKSPTLNQCLTRIVQQTQSFQMPPEPDYRSQQSPDPPPNWQKFLPWNTD